MKTNRRRRAHTSFEDVGHLWRCGRLSEIRSEDMGCGGMGGKRGEVVVRGEEEVRRDATSYNYETRVALTKERVIKHFQQTRCLFVYFAETRRQTTLIDLNSRVT